MDPVLSVAPQFKGKITFHDLLSTEGAISFKIDKTARLCNGIIFSLFSDSFKMQLSIQNQSIVFIRNEYIGTCIFSDLLVESEMLLVLVQWTYKDLFVECGYSYENRKAITVSTKPIEPPVSLIRWARLNDLLRKETYKNTYEFRSTIHSILQTVNRKIAENNMYKSFYNIEYNGNKIIKTEPKKEVEIQPIISGLLSDLFLQKSIEVMPEYKTGQGNVDFVLSAYIEGSGIEKFCIECKLSHSQDLENGLLVQLPIYMRSLNVEFGAYCVLNFYDEEEELKRSSSLHLDFYLEQLSIEKCDPLLKNIRIFVINLKKPLTASIR